MYGSSLEKGSLDADAKVRRAALVEGTSLELARYCRRLFGVEETIWGIFSPFVPYALYQFAVIQLRIMQRDPNPLYEANILFLKKVLGYFNKRLLVAGRYLRELQVDSPPLLLRPA